MVRDKVESFINHKNFVQSDRVGQSASDYYLFMFDNGYTVMVYLYYGDAVDYEDVDEEEYVGYGMRVVEVDRIDDRYRVSNTGLNPLEEWMPFGSIRDDDAVSNVFEALDRIDKLDKYEPLTTKADKFFAAMGRIHSEIDTLKDHAVDAIMELEGIESVLMPSPDSSNESYDELSPLNKDVIDYMAYSQIINILKEDPDNRGKQAMIDFVKIRRKQLSSYDLIQMALPKEVTP